MTPGGFITKRDDSTDASTAPLVNENAVDGMVTRDELPFDGNRVRLTSWEIATAQSPKRSQSLSPFDSTGSGLVSGRGTNPNNKPKRESNRIRDFSRQESLEIRSH